MEEGWASIFLTWAVTYSNRKLDVSTDQSEQTTGLQPSIKMPQYIFCYFILKSWSTFLPDFLLEKFMCTNEKKVNYKKLFN